MSKKTKEVQLRQAVKLAQQVGKKLEKALATPAPRPRFKPGWEKLGVVGVDSGQLMVCDPCYLESEWNCPKDRADITQAPAGEFSYGGCCGATLGPRGAGQLNYRLGHAGAGVVWSSGYGDGVYPVYGRRNRAGQIVEVKIVME
jgi:hypothetical protein